MTRLGKRPNYMTRLGKRSSNYLTRLGKRSGPISSQPGEDLVRRRIHFNPVRGAFIMELPDWMNYVFPHFVPPLIVALILHCFSEAVIKSEERRSPAIYDIMKFGKRSDLMIPRRGYRDWMTRLGWLAQPKVFFNLFNWNHSWVVDISVTCYVILLIIISYLNSCHFHLVSSINN